MLVEPGYVKVLVKFSVQRSVKTRVDAIALHGQSVTPGDQLRLDLLRKTGFARAQIQGLAGVLAQIE